MWSPTPASFSVARSRSSPIEEAFKEQQHVSQVRMQILIEGAEECIARLLSCSATVVLGVATAFASPLARVRLVPAFVVILPFAARRRRSSSRRGRSLDELKVVNRGAVELHQH